MAGGSFSHCIGMVLVNGSRPNGPIRERACELAFGQFGTGQECPCIIGRRGGRRGAGEGVSAQSLHHNRASNTVFSLNYTELKDQEISL